MKINDIFFSGTGNSRWVAETLSTQLNDNLVSIENVLNSSNNYSLGTGERLGFVFPVYAWGIPEFIVNFIQNIEIAQVDYVYFVCTCGDDTGLTKEQFVKVVQKKGWVVCAGFSVRMPNTYVCLPGFDIDSFELQKSKKNEAEKRMTEITNAIKEYRKGVFDVYPGPMPWIKSKVLKPLFEKCLITAKPFKTTKSCIGCGKCAKDCPMSNILIDSTDGKPRWSDKCVSCLRCYHFCPTNSVQFGHFTNGKGQYHY